MTKRKAISKKIRFDTFKRDMFACQYCGLPPPSVILEIDHIHPVSKGGDNHQDNLLTACFDCNRGKAASLITEALPQTSEKIAIQKERQEQLKEYEALLSKKRAVLNRNVNALNKIFSDATDHSFSDSFKVSVRGFFEQLPRPVVFDSMSIAIGMGFDDAGVTARYFCGICWNRIRGDEHG